MKWSHEIPMTFSVGPMPVGITRVMRGVTEATLSDGRLVHLVLHVDGATVDAEGKLDVTYTVIPEVIEVDGLVHPTHETIQ